MNPRRRRHQRIARRLRRRPARRALRIYDVSRITITVGGVTFSAAYGGFADDGPIVIGRATLDQHASQEPEGHEVWEAITRGRRVS